MGVPSDPVPASDAVRVRMSRQRRRDTEPERALRRRLHARGLRYRVNVGVPDRPRRTIDIAFTRAKVAVFVDGCFWHACPIHGTSPTNNSVWWAEKLRKNVARDADTDAVLTSLGWLSLRIWEHEGSESAASRVEAEVRRRAS